MGIVMPLPSPFLSLQAIVHSVTTGGLSGMWPSLSRIQSGGGEVIVYSSLTSSPCSRYPFLLGQNSSLCSEKDKVLHRVPFHWRWASGRGRAY